MVRALQVSERNSGHVSITRLSDNQNARCLARWSSLDPKDFKFRILSRSLQTAVEEWSGIQKPTPESGKLEKRLDIYTNDEPLMGRILTEQVQADLLRWAERERGNRISDIRNYEDKMIYAVTGEMDNYEDAKLLVDSACRFFDTVRKVSESSGGSSDT